MNPYEEIRGDRMNRLDPASPLFVLAFPELQAGVLRRSLSQEQILERAYLYLLASAKAILQSYDINDPLLAEEIVDEFIKRVFLRKALNNFKPELGNIADYLDGIMRRTALERLRLRLRRRIQNKRYQAILKVPDFEPRLIAESKELIELLRIWAMQLPPMQRRAVARKYEALRHLDDGGLVLNERVNRHRGLKYLKGKARKSTA